MSRSTLKLQAAPLARLVAADPRADSGTREISIAAETIAIDRRVAGVRMRLNVPARSFRGVSLAVHGDAPRFFYRVALVHGDPELDVVLAESANETDAAAEWHAWATFFRLPRLAQRAGAVATIERPFGEVSAREIQPRRRGWPLKGRRSTISQRRKAGLKGQAAAFYRGEREIICYE